MIRRAEAQDLFVAGVWNFGPSVRHRRSGMVCHFAAGAELNSVSVYDKAPTRGDDVGCNTTIARATLSHFASRSSLVGGYEAASAGAVQAFLTRVPDAKPYTGEAYEPPVEGMPRHLVRRFEYETNGVKLYSRVTVVDAGQWLLTQRVTAPLAHAASVDHLAAMSLLTTARSMGVEVRPTGVLTR